jgi:hypothetical protein
MSSPRTPALTPDNHHCHPSTITPYEKLLKLLKDSATQINLENFIMTDDSDHDQETVTKRETKIIYHFVLY